VRGCRSAVGIDHQDYFLWNVEPREITDELRDAAASSLREIQGRMREATTELGRDDSTDAATPRVDLRIDDINCCSLPEAGFDLITSWQTLEHIVPPEPAFAAMGRLLRPGGICFHQYGAFTFRAGGHALCTLDFPWGHVRLGDADMDRYLEQFRPEEYAHAIRHYRRFLNRLVLADLPRLARQAGLELIHKTVWLDRQQFEDELQSEYVNEARRHYPDITFEDLIHESIWILLRKPA
jgi:SAM-dependent methyltransferase